MLSQKKDRNRTGCKTTKRLLGKILVEGRFIPPRDLDLAIELQAKTNSQLGEILVHMGVLDPAELSAVLAIQKDLASLEEAVKIGAGVRLLLGELLIKAKRISREQLELALGEQQRTGEKLGTILVRQGLLKKKELYAVLAFQQSQCGEAPASDKLKLGELLVTTGQITREQLEDVLTRQKLSQRKIGELLIEAGYVRPHQVDFGLKLQQKLLTAALVAVLSLSNLIGAQTAHADETSRAAGNGPYVGAGLAVDSFTGPHDKYLSPGSGLDLKAGYRSGPVALEGEWVSSGHNDKDPGFVRADFYGLSLDLKVFGPYLNEHNQLYGLLGVGSYAINEYPYGGSRTALRGNGMNLGVGVEHYLNGRCQCNIVSLNLGLTYRIIKYGNPDTGTVPSALANDKNGDMLSLEAGVSFHY